MESTQQTEAHQLAGERETLTGVLDLQRETLARKCAGLTADQLRLRAVEPSALSLLGLVRHLTDVELGWFDRILSGGDAPFRYWHDAPDGADFDVDGADVDESLRLWRSVCDRSRAIVAAVESLDTVGVHEATGDRYSLRWILVHMIEEYARHNGHADLIRERIDGRTGA
ncbi:DinB family protein [Nocardia thraciensis]